MRRKCLIHCDAPPLLIALTFLGGAMLTAVPLAQMGFVFFSGAVPANAALVTLVTTILVGLPIFYSLAVIIGRLQQARERLEKTQARLERKIEALATTEALLRDAHETLEERVKERTFELEEARDAATLANTTKSRFLANMSHELRTPLNAIIGFSEMITLRDSLFPDGGAHKIDDYAVSIHRSGQHLLSLVNDLLDLSRIEGGAMKCEPLEHGLAEVIALACETIEPVARERGQRILVDSHVDQVFADPRAVQQILVNLLSNASKYAPDETQITVESRGDGSDLILSVVDHGRGMTPQQLDVAMTPYASFAEAHVARKESSGLGLSIVLALAKAHRGSVEIESEVGVGTVVRVRLCDALIMGARPARWVA